MAHKFLDLYIALAKSSLFFTIIDSDEFLYWYDGNGLTHDSSILDYFAKNRNVHFFPSYWMENIDERDDIYNFHDGNLWRFHMGKPVISARIVSLLLKDYLAGNFPILHHTKDLPLSTYGSAPTGIILLHRKNQNKIQRLKANMEKLTAFRICKTSKDFATIMKINADDVTPAHVRSYVLEVKKLIDDMRLTNKKLNSLETVSNDSGIMIIKPNGNISFIPPNRQNDFNNLIGNNTDYFKLFGYNPSVYDDKPLTTINSYLQR
jgi:hypothetical protein